MPLVAKPHAALNLKPTLHRASTPKPHTRRPNSAPSRTSHIKRSTSTPAKRTKPAKAVLQLPPQTDACALLGVDPSASMAEIRSAWKRAALATHPDKASHGDFQAVQAAYEALCERSAARSHERAAERRAACERVYAMWEDQRREQSERQVQPPKTSYFTIKPSTIYHCSADCRVLQLQRAAQPTGVALQCDAACPPGLEPCKSCVSCPSPPRASSRPQAVATSPAKGRLGYLASPPAIRLEGAPFLLSEQKEALQHVH